MSSTQKSNKHSNSQDVSQGIKCRWMKNTHARFSQISIWMAFGSWWILWAWSTMKDYKTNQLTLSNSLRQQQITQEQSATKRSEPDIDQHSRSCSKEEEKYWRCKE